MKKLVLPTIMAIPITPIFEFFEKFIFAEWLFAGFLMVVFALDTLTGFWKHWIAHDVSSRAWGMVATKFLLYATVLIVAHVLGAMLCELGDASIIDKYIAPMEVLPRYMCVMLIIRESLSILENVEEIRPGTIPIWVVRRLKGFDNERGIKTE